MKGLINVLIREKIYWIEYKEFIFSLQPWGLENEEREREPGKGKEEWGKKKIFSYEEF